MNRTLKTLVVAALSLGSSLAQKPARPAPTPAAETTGVCSFYASRYNGHVTASGKRFNNNAMTAAHRTFPMGTKLKLTNLGNGKSVVVTVNDRGPFVKDRDISVTRRAAQKLGFIKQGTARVRIERVQ